MTAKTAPHGKKANAIGGAGIVARIHQFIRFYPWRSQEDLARWREGDWWPWSRNDWKKNWLGQWVLKEVGGDLAYRPTTDELDSIRRCVEWAIPQLNCGNITPDGYWDYLVFMFARVSPDAMTREITERLFRAENERDHLRYLQSRNKL